jgi:hypothetical protein
MQAAARVALLMMLHAWVGCSSCAGAAMKY